MSASVVARTDHGLCGWWCRVHERFTGCANYCPFCDEPEGTSDAH